MFCNRVVKEHFYLCFHNEMNDMAMSEAGIRREEAIDFLCE